MIIIVTTLALAAVAATLALHDAKPWRRPPASLSVTITADTSRFDEAMALAAASMPAAADFERTWQQLNEILAPAPEDIERLAHELACFTQTPSTPDPSDPTRKDQPHQ